MDLTQLFLVTALFQIGVLGGVGIISSLLWGKIKHAHMINIVIENKKGEVDCCVKEEYQSEDDLEEGDDEDLEEDDQDASEVDAPDEQE